MHFIMYDQTYLFNLHYNNYIFVFTGGASLRRPPRMASRFASSGGIMFTARRRSHSSQSPVSFNLGIIWQLPIDYGQDAVPGGREVANQASNGRCQWSPKVSGLYTFRKKWFLLTYNDRKIWSEKLALDEVTPAVVSVKLLLTRNGDERRVCYPKHT